MEDEGRPTKLRKLSHSTADDGQAAPTKFESNLTENGDELASKEGEADDDQDQQPADAGLARHVTLPITILVDCGFDSLMVEKEIVSLGSQLTRSYADNHRAPFQAHLAISSWGGNLKQRFDTLLNQHYLNWKRVRFEEEDFSAVADKARVWMGGEDGGKLDSVFRKYQSTAVEDKGKNDSEAGADEPPASAVQQSSEGSDVNDDLRSKGEIVYLTSDSPYTLTELKPYSTYIVGGLVDKNRYKGICYKKACEKGIKTAKLPIGEYMSMQSRFVLATNHVVEIMVRWLECGDWGEAFMRVIPKRKGGTLKGEDDGDDGDDKADQNEG
ncbi:hypothetical protein DV735_g4971, partial [Chaetothyriales sp. CBS 134920]